jgi:predicted nicotinamide N-methyase
VAELLKTLRFYGERITPEEQQNATDESADDDLLHGPFFFNHTCSLCTIKEWHKFLTRAQISVVFQHEKRRVIKRRQNSLH